MATIQDPMRLKFRTKGTRFGVTRGTVKALAAKLDITETQVIHLALSKLAAEVLLAYEQDEGPLTGRELVTVRRAAMKALPTGKVLDVKSLF